VYVKVPLANVLADAMGYPNNFSPLAAAVVIAAIVAAVVVWILRRVQAPWVAALPIAAVIGALVGYAWYL